MSKVFNVIGGIGMLIGIYLFLSNGTTTVKIINTISSNMLNGIQILQGRESKISEG